MAVIINDVYQKVLAIANKEQRGYITPQEFNLFANQAQMDIFEQYFYDLNQFGRVPGNNTEYSDMLDLLEEKISIFDQFKVSMSAVSGNQLTLPTDVYRLGTVFYGGAGYDVEVEKVNKKDLEYMSRTALYAPTDSRPVYTKKSETLLKLFPASPSTSYTTGNVTCNYIKKPATVKWTYTVSDTYKALYNGSANDLVNFELHKSEENNLVIKILQLAGISTKDSVLYQAAAAEEQKSIQQEKQ